MSTPYYERSEWPAFLAAIKAAPMDDLLRLVAADWLDELETDEARQRAEWIRYAVELPHCEFTWMANSGHCRPVELLGLHGWAWASDGERGAYLIHGETRYWIDRGFVSRVSAPLGVLHGGECVACNGVGQNGTLAGAMGCIRCSTGPRSRGTGRTTGVLAELLRREPITAVQITDIHPDPTSGDMWIWPEEAFDRWPEVAEHFGQYAYDSQDEAIKAMSNWLIRYHTENYRGS